MGHFVADPSNATANVAATMVQFHPAKCGGERSTDRHRLRKVPQDTRRLEPRIEHAQKTPVDTGPTAATDEHDRPADNHNGDPQRDRPGMISEIIADADQTSGRLGNGDAEIMNNLLELRHDP